MNANTKNNMKKDLKFFFGFLLYVLYIVLLAIIDLN